MSEFKGNVFIDPKQLTSYGDAANDGAVQLSFTLPIPYGALATNVLFCPGAANVYIETSALLKGIAEIRTSLEPVRCSIAVLNMSIAPGGAETVEPNCKIPSSMSLELFAGSLNWYLIRENSG